MGLDLPRHYHQQKEDHRRAFIVTEKKIVGWGGAKNTPP